MQLPQWILFLGYQLKALAKGLDVPIIARASFTIAACPLVALERLHMLPLLAGRGKRLESGFNRTLDVAGPAPDPRAPPGATAWLFPGRLPVVASARKVGRRSLCRSPRRRDRAPF